MLKNAPNEASDFRLDKMNRSVNVMRASVERWLKSDLRMLAVNVIGGALFYLFVVKPYLGEQSWFIACIPALVSINTMLLRPLYNRIRSKTVDERPYGADKK